MIVAPMTAQAWRPNTGAAKHPVLRTPEALASWLAEPHPLHPNPGECFFLYSPMDASVATCPRLTKLAERAPTPTWHVDAVGIDFDTEPHVPWPHDVDVRGTIEGFLTPAAKDRAARQDRIWWYATPKGFRLLVWLAKPLPLSQGAFAEMTQKILAYSIRSDARWPNGALVKADANAKDWTRALRTPRAFATPACASWNTLRNAPVHVGDPAPVAPTPAAPPPVADPTAYLRAFDDDGFGVPLRTEQPPVPVSAVPQASRLRLPDAFMPNPEDPLDASPPLQDDGSRPATAQVSTHRILEAMRLRKFPDLRTIREKGKLASTGNRDAALSTSLYRAMRLVWDMCGAEEEPDLQQTEDALMALYLPCVQAWADEVDPPDEYVLARKISDKYNYVQTVYRQERAKNAASKACTQRLNTLGLPPIVVNGLHQMVLCRESEQQWTYRAVAKEQIVKFLEADGPEGLLLRDEKGSPKNYQRLLSEFSSTLMNFEYTYGLEQPAYDATRRTLQAPACRLRPALPIHHEDIAQWLRLLADEEHRIEALNLWLATTHMLDYPTAAIYFCGAGGAGKSLFADLVGSLWSRRPITFEQVETAHPEMLLSTPVIVVNEKLPKMESRGDATAIFRRTITDSARYVNIKNGPNVAVNGYLRVIVAANDYDALGFRGRFTEDAVRAITERLLFFEASEAARDYLEEVGAPRIRKWVAQDFAEHVAWLRENTEFNVAEKRTRMLVPGQPSKWHDDLKNSLSAVNRFFGVCAMLMKKPNMWSSCFRITTDPKRGLCIGLNAASIVDAWPVQSAAFGRAPDSVTFVSKALAKEAATLRRLNNRRFWFVPVKHLEEAGDAFEQFDAAELDKILSRHQEAFTVDYKDESVPLEVE